MCRIQESVKYVENSLKPRPAMRNTVPESASWKRGGIVREWEEALQKPTARHASSAEKTSRRRIKKRGTVPMNATG